MKITSTVGRRVFSTMISPLVGLFCLLNVPPNVITITGFVIQATSVYFICDGRLVLAGILILVGGSMDMVDGELARRRGIISKFGAFFDSFFDRYSDTVVLLGFLYYFSTKGEILYTILTGVAIVGAMMVSYARARAEGLGVECKTGVFERTERLLTIVVGALFGGVVLKVAFWILAIGSHLTSVQRFVYVWIKSKD